MNQPQNTPAAKIETIKVRIDLEVSFGGADANMASLSALVDKTKPVIAAASQIGASATAVAMFGKQKIKIV
jgi:hypothetical protein